jgi:hypothetical protein
MNSPDRARELGRNVERILRARIGLGIVHVFLGVCALFIVRYAVDTGKSHDWWYAPIRSMHLRRVPIFSLPWLITVGSFVIPPVPYVISWTRIQDSILEQTDGAQYWLSLTTYSCGLIFLSSVSDYLYILAIRPPLNLEAFIGVTVGSVVAFLSLASLVEFLFTGEAREY